MMAFHQLYLRNKNRLCLAVCLSGFVLFSDDQIPLHTMNRFGELVKTT